MLLLGTMLRIRDTFRSIQRITDMQVYVLESSSCGQLSHL